jgi:hypothetical protein
MRVFAAFVYCLLFTIVAVWAWGYRAAHPVVHLAATVELPANRLLQPADLDLQTGTGVERMSGKYLVRKVSKDEAVAEIDTAYLPSLAPTKGTIQLVLTVERPEVESGHLNAGDVVHVCSAAKEALAGDAGAKVRAVICGNGPAAACSAIVEITPDKIAPLVEAFRTDPPPSPRQPSRKCE